MIVFIDSGMLDLLTMDLDFTNLLAWVTLSY